MAFMLQNLQIILSRGVFGTIHLLFSLWNSSELVFNFAISSFFLKLIVLYRYEGYSSFGLIIFL